MNEQLLVLLSVMGEFGWTELHFNYVFQALKVVDPKFDESPYVAWLEDKIGGASDLRLKGERGY